MAKSSKPYPIGRKIAGVRWMTTAESESEGWCDGHYDRAVVVVLDDGSLLYASCDPEGNGPGCMYGKTGKGEAFYVAPAEVSK